MPYRRNCVKRFPLERLHLAEAAAEAKSCANAFSISKSAYYVDTYYQGMVDHQVPINQAHKNHHAI